MQGLIWEREGLRSGGGQDNQKSDTIFNLYQDRVEHLERIVEEMKTRDEREDKHESSSSVMKVLESKFHHELLSSDSTGSLKDINVCFILCLYLLLYLPEHTFIETQLWIYSNIKHPAPSPCKLQVQTQKA